MSEIAFSIKEQTPTRIVFNTSIDSSKFDLSFYFSEPPTADTSLLANALSTMFGPAFDRVHFDFPVDDLIVEDIATWTRSEVTASGSAKLELPNYSTGTVLNFSGGFDSLAAKYLIPGKTTLVSLDFGGNFARERRFFEGFNPLIISTNLLKTPLKGKCWAFMGMGPLFYRDQIPAKYFTFGSIWESSRLRRKAPNLRVPTFPPFAAAGYQNAPFVQGITEVGTLMVLLTHCPELIEQSIPSLALPGEEKYSRKIGLAQLVAKKLNVDINTPSYPENAKVHYEFGKSLPVDLTAMYFYSEGREDLAKLLVKSIPEFVKNDVESNGMEFMYKADPSFYAKFPNELRASLDSGLASAKIHYYDRSDVNRIESIRHLLGEYYSFA